MRVYVEIEARSDGHRGPSIYSSAGSMFNDICV